MTYWIGWFGINVKLVSEMRYLECTHSEKQTRKHKMNIMSLLREREMHFCQCQSILLFLWPCYWRIKSNSVSLKSSES